MHIYLNHQVRKNRSFQIQVDLKLVQILLASKAATQFFFERRKKLFFAAASIMMYQLEQSKHEKWRKQLRRHTWTHRNRFAVLKVSNYSVSALPHNFSSLIVALEMEPKWVDEASLTSKLSSSWWQSICSPLILSKFGLTTILCWNHAWHESDIIRFGNEANASTSKKPLRLLRFNPWNNKHDIYQ